MPSKINTDTILYADDSTAVVCCKNIEELAWTTKQTLQELEHWIKNNAMKLNLEKTQIIHFRTKQTTECISKIEYTGKELTTAERVKFLGITLNKNLSWTDHVDSLLKRLNSLVYAMRVLHNVTDLPVKRIVYHAYFITVIKYGIIFWGVEKTNLLRIFKLQKKIIRAMTGTNSRHSCKPLFESLDLMTIPSIFIYEILLFEQNNSQLFEGNAFTHDYETRHKLQYMLPCHRLKFYENTPYYMALKIRNKIRSKLGETTLETIGTYLKRKCYYSLEEFLND